MAVLARNTITLAWVKDIASITRYYLLQASDLPAPAKPSTLIPAGWSTTEPTYTPGETAMTLYVCDKTTYSDTTYEYTDVSVSSAYAAVNQLAENDWKYFHFYAVSGNLWSFEAHLYHAGIDVTQDIPADNFLWYKKTQAGKTLLGSGRTITVDVTGFELGGAVVGVYSDELHVVTLSGETVVFDSGNVLDLLNIAAEINAEQDLHGYDSAWGPGGMGNWFPPAVSGVQSDSGITVTSDGEGRITLDVASTATKSFTLMLSEAVTIESGMYLHLMNDIATGSISIDFRNASARVFGCAASPLARTQDLSSYAGQTVDRISFYVPSGNTYTLNLTPMFVKSSTAMAFKPYTNICPITGIDEVNLVHSPTTDVEDGTTYTISLASAGTVYGGTLNVTAGTLTVTHGVIASYAGETLPGAWMSSMDTYVEGGTPTTGAQVVYELATPQTYSLTPTQIQMLTGTNRFWADSGDVMVTLLQEGS